MTYDLECQITVDPSLSPGSEERLLEAIWSFEEFLKANGIGFVLDLKDADTQCRILRSVYSRSGFEQRNMVSRQ